MADTGKVASESTAEPRTTRGNTPDYLLGTQEGWGALRVVRFHSVEELSRPFHYAITLLRPRADGALDLGALVDTGATFCIRTTAGFRAIHGILAEAEEVEQTRTLRVFRVLFTPHLERARFRQSCQVFRDRSIVDIVSAVLRNDTPARPGGAGGLVPFDGKVSPFGADIDLDAFFEPIGAFRWALVGDDAARLSDPRYREHVTQYNETDFDFVSRLLEEEGISYFFEHDARGSILTLTDHPGRVALLQPEEHHTLRGLDDLGGADSQGREIIRSFRHAGRIGIGAVRVRDYAPEEPLTRVEAVVGDRSAAMFTEVPVPAGRGVRGDACRVPASIRLERSAAERHFAEGSGTVRSLQAGLRVHLHDQDGLREDADLLIVRVETHARELLPEGLALPEEEKGQGFESRFVALPMAFRFRPARVTKKPRIAGIQDAIVTAEEWSDGREINTNKQGDVRIRFPWDERPEAPGVSSSRWVRVSEPFGGVGHGAMWTPRVGDLVVVGFREGDPDDPVIVGRAYSTQMPAPYDAEKHPTVSTFKTRSSPGGAGFNELCFDDAAGAERVDLTAQRDLSVRVGRDATVFIGRHEDVTVRGDVRRNVVGRQIEAVEGDAELASTGRLALSGVGVALHSQATMKLSATGDMTLSTEADRTDETHANHFIRSGSTYLRSKDVVQVVAPHFHVFADDIRLVCGGSAIIISKDGIQITSSGNVEVSGALVKLNCD